MTTLDQPIGTAVLHLLSDVSEGDAEFVRWCNELHHPEVLQRDGFLSVRRFEAHTPGAPRHLTIYELADAEAAGQPPAVVETPMPAAVLGLRYERAVYQQLGPIGPSQPIGGAVADRVGAADDELAEDDRLGRTGVLSVRRFVEATDGPVRRRLTLCQLSHAGAASGLTRVYRQTFPPRGWLTSKGACP